MKPQLIFAAMFVAPLFAQQPAQGPAAPPTVIRTETREVLVDVVVTDKKSNYLPDLEMKDFKVWEDNKEQQIKSFSFGASDSTPEGKQRYLVLFFDNSTMSAAEQVQSRQQAAKFIASNAGPDKLMAVVNFTGSLQVTQNFTDDIQRLQAAVQGIKMSAVSSNGGIGLGRAGADYGARSLFMGLISLSRNLNEIRGRKSLILFTSGFPLGNNDTLRTELTATIAQCNKSNVAVYPIDARGLSPLGPGINDRMDPTNPNRGRGGRMMLLPETRRAGIALAAFPVLRIATLFQTRGGGTTGGGTTGGGAAGGGGATGGGAGRGVGGGGGTTGGGGAGGAAGGRGGVSGGTNPGSTNPGGGVVNRGGNTNPGNNNGNINRGGGFDPNNPNNPNNRNNPFGGRGIMPEMPTNIGDRQELMYALAAGTGGFVIVNTNDLLAGLEKIGREQNQYYVLAYTPPESLEGSCHTLKVKVDRGGTQVRSRTGYCNVKSHDSLAGSSVEKTLETRVTGNAPGNVTASMRAPFFYTSPETARVAVAMEIPLDKLKFEKVKGKQHAAINLLGIAYRQDGTVAARFSDAVKWDFENNKEADKFKATPLHYENQFDVGTGAYTLKVAFDSGGENFGKLETPLAINAYDGKQFALSALALSTKFGPSSQAEINMDSILLEGRSPLVAGPLQFTPTGAVRFSRYDNVVMYFEVYEPLLSDETKKPQLGAQVRILDASGAEKTDSGTVSIDNYVRAGSPVVATGLKIPLTGLTSGAYKVEVKALDSAGNFAVRTADFAIE